MTARERILRELLGEWDGTVVPPAGFVAPPAEEPSDLAAAIEEATTIAISGLHDVPGLLSGHAMSTARRMHLARRLGWTVATLRDWDGASDRSGILLEAALASAAAWDSGGGFWRACDAHLRGLPFVKALRLILKRRSVRTSTQEDARTYEIEMLADFDKAEAGCDWAQLSELVRAFGTPRLDASARQAALALAHLGRPILTGLADATRSWATAHLLVGSLDLADACRLATATTSGHVRFAVLEQTMRDQRELAPAETTSLSHLLIALSKDRGAWPAWLHVFNHFPIRAPHMQGAIGRALAHCDERALEQYVESISLSSSDGEARLLVTRAMATFRAYAPPKRQHGLWRLSFDRWRRWDFASGEGTRPTDVARCELDYAVVGWLTSREAGQSAGAESAFSTELRGIEAGWHASISSARKCYLKALSRYQVHRHAEGRSALGADWLPPAEILIPAAAGPFHRARYG